MISVNEKFISETRCHFQNSVVSSLLTLMKEKHSPTNDAFWAMYFSFFLCSVHLKQYKDYIKYIIILFY